MRKMSGKWSLVFVILLSLPFTEAHSEADNKENCNYVVYNVQQMNQVIRVIIIIIKPKIIYCLCMLLPFEAMHSYVI